MTATLPSNSSTAPARSAPDLETIDPTSPASPVNVAEYGFEGRFEDWTADTRYFEYTRAADPVGLGYTPSVPAERFGPELWQGGRTRITPWTSPNRSGSPTVRHASGPGSPLREHPCRRQDPHRGRTRPRSCTTS